MMLAPLGKEVATFLVLLGQTLDGPVVSGLPVTVRSRFQTRRSRSYHGQVSLTLSTLGETLPSWQWLMTQYIVVDMREHKPCFLAIICQYYDASHDNSGELFTPDEPKH